MVKPESALRRLMRETGKLLEPYGFEGADPTWTRIQDSGIATVGRTRLLRTWTAGEQVLRFGLTLSATPAPWWTFCNWRNTRLGLPAIPLEKATGPAQLTDSALPAPMTTLWTMHADPTTPGHIAPSDIDRIRTDLPRRVHTYARRSLRLLNPDHHLEELLALPEKTRATWEAIAILLAAQGPTPDLDNALTHLTDLTPEPPTLAEEIHTYAQSRPAMV
ncbi:hypothetical protein JK358_07855 [Nocardia sp. 2]|uniref:Transcriptional regulator, AbiEi antitoxin, Type IV TA system n=1 Tax=Nocardia acididurans TaxID=2802282 RepID=A0ABS1M188_9NOCA|nr:hypothetical protein [Nocardia acididurans]MBL1074309.1 hypothetical protein [Nocardia acididurans]